VGVAENRGFQYPPAPQQDPFGPTVILVPQFKKSYLQTDGCTEKCVRIPNWRTSEVWVIFSLRNGGVMRIFGPKRDEITGGYRKLHNEEFHNLYSSPSIIRMIKSRRMRGAGHLARMGGEEKYI
jgi:hypothetical protein